MSGYLPMDQRKVLALLLALALVRGLIYAAVTPPWQSPDETGHFEYAWLIAHLGRLPTRQDISPSFEQDLIDSLYQWRYGQLIGRPLPEQMPVRIHNLPEGTFVRRSRTVLQERISSAYVWMALFIWPARGRDLLVQLYAARLASVVLGLGIVWMAWRIFQGVLPRQRWLVVAMTAFVVFLPQHTFINASAGDGTLAALAACVVIYGWLRLFRGPVRRVDVILVLGGTVVGLTAKGTVLFLVPFDLLALGLLTLTRPQSTSRPKRWVYLVSGCVLIVLLAGIAWLTPFGYRVWRLARRWWNTPEIYLAGGDITFGEALTQTYDSFWAQFGWMSVRAQDSWYVAVYILTALSVVGWILPRPCRWPTPAYAKWVLGIALLMAIGVLLASLLLTPTGLSFSQGRYLFPVIVPVAFFLVGGWACWVPEHRHRALASGVVLLFAALDFVAISAMWPHYYMGLYG
jgi:hypothetical protein